MYESIIRSSEELCKKGFGVFPCAYKSKKPIVDIELGFTQGLKSATKDVSKIITFAKKHQLCNLAVNLEGYMVVDMDIKNNGHITLADLEAKHGTIPLTPTVKTGSNGRHYYFTLPKTSIGNWTNAKTGIDVKTTGGYVIVPPSIHENGNAYEWIHDLNRTIVDCPQWLLDFIIANHTKSKTLTDTKTKTLTDTKTTFTFQDEDNDDLFTHKGASEGERNAVLCRLIGKHLARGDSSHTIKNGVLQWASHCNPAYNENEALKTLDVIARKEEAKASATSMSTASSTSTSCNELQEREDEGLLDVAYHGIVGDYVKAIEPHTEADPSAILISTLIAAGNVIGNKPYYVTDGDKQHVNLFGVFVGESGNARKGVSLKRALAILDDDFRQRNIVNGLSSGEGLRNSNKNALNRRFFWVCDDKRLFLLQSLIGAIKDEISKFDVATGKVEIVEPGVQDKRLLVTETEFAQTLKVVKREGNTLSPILRNAFDGMNLSALTKQRQTATNPHVSIIAHITLTELQKTLTETETFNGFANRFLWASSRRSKYLPDGGEDVDVEPFRQRLRQAILFAQSVGEMKRSEAAKTLWRTLYVNALNSEHPILTRASAITLRLSMIYALLDSSSIIEEVHLKAAYAVWRYAEQSVRFIFGKGEDDTFTAKVYEVVVAHAGVSRSDLYAHFGRNIKMPRIEDALKRLEATQKVYAKKDDATGGRPAERWYPTPKTPETPKRQNAETNMPTSSVNDVNGVSGVSGVTASTTTSGVNDVSGVNGVSGVASSTTPKALPFDPYFDGEAKTKDCLTADEGVLSEEDFFADLLIAPKGH